MKKFSSLIYVILIALLVFSPTVSAQGTVSSVSESYLTLSRYLQHIKAGELNQVLALVQDSRFTPANVSTEYQKLLQDNNMKLLDYKITKTVYSTATKAQYLTTLTFMNGAVQQVPFELRYDDSWKVWITPESLEHNPVQELKPATKKFAVTSNISATSAYTKVISWNYSNRSEGYYFYSIDSINFTKSSSEKIVLDVFQWVDNSNGGVPDIEYSIIEPSWFGDNIWGTVTGTGTYYTKIKTLTMTGIDQDVSNGKLRFKIRVTGTESTYSGSGTAYIQ